MNLQRGDRVVVLAVSDRDPERIRGWIGQEVEVWDGNCLGMGIVEVIHPESGEAWNFTPEMLRVVTPTPQREALNEGEWMLRPHQPYEVRLKVHAAYFTDQPYVDNAGRQWAIRRTPVGAYILSPLQEAI